MNKNLHKISIITVVYNHRKGFEKTITSILEQTYGNYEYIVIDGGSTDGTLDIIDKYVKSINYWTSNPDNGIYDAMNKGAERSSGEYLYYLNAGDFFYNADVLQTVSGYMDSDAISLISGNVVNLYPNFQCVSKPNFANFKWGGGIPHQGSFISRRVFNELGGHNTEYLSSGDLDFFCKFYKGGYKYKKINDNIAFMPSGGFSSNKRICLSESYKVIRHHFGFYPATFFYLKAVIIEQGIKKFLIKIGLRNVYLKLLQLKMERSSK